MFLDYYKLKEQPFGVTPDPRFLYLGPTHREALASLYYGVEAGRGFMALIAEPGMGKTTLLFQLLERLRKSANVAFLFQTQCDSREFFRYLLSDIGIECQGNDVVQMHEQLNQALVRLKHAGMRFVLIVDEAQNLDDSVLETIRLLSDFETPSSKLMQIILSGQPQLAAKLAGPSLLQLRQRISILSRLQPFNPEETSKYIDHRLQVAGHDGGPLFASEARAMIAARSGGIPRNINNLCFNALTLACAMGRKKVDADTILETAKDLDFEGLAREHSARVQIPDLPPQVQAPAMLAGRAELGPRPFLAVGFAASLLLAGLFLFPSVRALVGARLAEVYSAAHSTVPKPSGLDRPALGPAVPAAPHARTREAVKRARAPVTLPAASNVVVKVAAGQTLRHITVTHFGRADSKLIDEIRALNPRITDPNHIQIGQRIVLPPPLARNQELATNHCPYRSKHEQKLRILAAD